MSRPAINFKDALAACLDDLNRGASPAECLARFPEYAAELAPLLQAAERARREPLPALSLRGRVQGRQRMHAALAQRAAGSGWLRAWAGGLAGAAILLILAVGIWFSWPGRDDSLRGESTARPATPSLAATATPGASPTVAVTTGSSPTPVPSRTPTNDVTPVTATATATPGPTASATPSSTASTTPGPAATAIQGTEETPRTPEGTEPTETPEPTRAPVTVAPTLRPTERPEATPTPDREPSVTPTPDDDARETPEHKDP